MKNKKIAALFLTLLISTQLKADYLSWKEIEKRAKAEKINTKALSHIQCFFEKYENTVFQKKISYGGTEKRCSGNSEITLDKKRVFALIDYTAPSNDRRMFLIDRETGAISKMAVAHGKYNASMINTHLSLNKNSVKWAKYFSNELGSNAPSSGFFISGVEYEGKFGRSMTLHGLEDGINDNACQRAVVVHKHLMVTKSSARLLSAGCPMISKDYIDHVINLLEGSYNPDNGVETNGSVVFIYGEREKKWAASTCNGNFTI
jgi:hypothetical protein